MLNRSYLNMTSYKDLIDLAKDASQNAYAPYSNFKVGACVLSEQGNVVLCEREDCQVSKFLYEKVDAIYQELDAFGSSLAKADDSHVIGISETVILTVTSCPGNHLDLLGLGSFPLLI